MPILPRRVHGPIKPGRAPPAKARAHALKGLVGNFYTLLIDAWVVLPEHMHAVWTLPDGDAGYSLRWTLIKRWFSAAIPAGERRSESRVATGERGIWQRRFWEHTVRDPCDFARHVDYVHFNPVKHGLVARAVDWPYSSFRRAVARGDYPADWAREDDGVGGFGEVEGEPE